ncbi:MAG: ABC transporter permease [Candidatus Aminicenantes bacterium]|jgi:putative ABC transport system permease protein
MLKNYLIIALRNIRRQKLYAFIKIFGLSIGIAACILIYLFIVDELSFDNFHKNGDQLFRVVRVQYDQDTKKETGRQQFMPPPTGPELLKTSPEIRFQTRLVNGSGSVRYKDSLFRERLSFVDSHFFEMFSFPLIKGDPKTALSDTHSIVLTRSFADKYFGEEDPMGKMLTLTFGQTSKDYQVTGVTEDVPFNSSIQFNILIHFNDLPIVINNPGILDNWDRWYCPFFVQIQSNVSPEQAEQKLDQFCRQCFSSSIQGHIEEGYDPFTFGLQRVRDIHLDSRVGGNRGLTPSYLLAAIALVILLIACVNFMNLSMGLSSVRSMEVGMRKVLGAQRKQLLQQFLSEALVISVFAIFLGIIFTEMLLPKFNALAGKQLSISHLFAGPHVLALLGVVVLTSMCAGSYPAVVLSALRPVDIMKGKLRIGGRTTLTKALVVLQFSLTVILVISGIVLGRQVSFMVNRDPGYVSEGLVVVFTQEIEQTASERLCQLFQNEVISHSRIRGLTASNREFGLFLPSRSLELGERKIHFRYNRVDPHFLFTMKLRLIQGRDFSTNIAADNDAIIVNEKFMDSLGPDYELGQTLSALSDEFPYHLRVIGVVEDCHFESLRNEIEPLLLYVGKGMAPNRDRFSRIFVRIETGSLSETIGFLEKAWKKIRPNKPFRHYFQDDALENLYAQDKRWSAIVRFASVFSILLACLGIFGLTAMTLSRRVKEIGIRRVLGASVEQIVYLGIKEFVYLVCLANLIAWPIVYFIMQKVLQNYSYRIDIGLHYFLLSGTASVFLAGLTILYLSIRAALQNPVESLRYE